MCYIRLGIETLYGFEDGDESIPAAIAFFMEVEYVVGPVGDRFRLELDYQNATSRVLVNDQECNSASTLTCSSGFAAWHVDCTNVQKELFLNGCLTNLGAGALEILAGVDFQDSTFNGNCVPIT